MWKPIETAIPDMNVPILLGNKNRKFEPPFVGFRVIANRGMENEEVLNMDRYQLNFVEATHWQECPKQPK